MLSIFLVGFRIVATLFNLEKMQGRNPDYNPTRENCSGKKWKPNMVFVLLSLRNIIVVGVVVIEVVVVSIIAVIKINIVVILVVIVAIAAAVVVLCC